MASMKFKISWKTVLLPLLGLIGFFLYLYLFNVDIPKIIEKAKTVDSTIYLTAVVFVVFDTFFFSLSWHFLLNILRVRLSVLKSFMYVFYGMYIDILIPAESISAEISKVYLVTREQDGTTGKVVASLVIQRLVGMGLNIIGLFTGAIIMLTTAQASGLVLNLTLLLAILSTIFLVLLIAFCSKEAWTLKAIDAVIKFIEYVGRRRWKLEKIREDVFQSAKIFHDSMKEFKQAPKTLFTALFFAVVAWILSLGVNWLVFRSMNYPVDWSKIIITQSIVLALQGIPIGVPFEAGLPEITMTTLYIVLGVPFDISATATILIRLLTVWLRFFIGFAIQQGLEIKALTGQKTDKT